MNGESTTRAVGLGLALVFGAGAAFGVAFALGFTIGFALVLAFVFGFAAVDFAAADFAGAFFLRIFAAISVVRSSPKLWPLVVRGRGPRNEGRVRYQKILAISITILARRFGAILSANPPSFGYE